MSPSRKMRIFVQSLTSKLVVAIEPAKTIADLSLEVARRLSTSDVLELTLHGSLLSPEDRVDDVIMPDEVVHVKSGIPGDESEGSGITPGLSPPSGTSPDFIIKPSPRAMSPDLNVPGGIKRVKLAFVTPALARKGALGSIDKTMGFGGSAISTRLTMDVVRREALSVLGYRNDDSMAPLTTRRNGETMDGKCSCAVATEVTTRGISRNLHCPRKLDGSQCEIDDCPYSHSAIGPTFIPAITDMECKVCTELLGFPCEHCLREARDKNDGMNPPAQEIRYCPLVQNAGCSHLFHAHCYFSRFGPHLGCPAGCAAATYPAEPIAFDQPTAHIVLIHSGSTIERITLPSELLADDVTVLAETQLLDIVTTHLGHLKGLSVRLHGRKPDGLVRFRLSTVVSVCCTSRHPTEDGVIRFQRNGPLEIRAVESLVDLHTVASPIFNLSPDITIEELGLDEGVPNDGEVCLFIVGRDPSQAYSSGKRPIGKSQVYTLRPEWYPSVQQSERGMAAYLCSLLVLSHHLATCKDTKKQQQDMLYYLLGLTRFPPAVRTLARLIANESPEPMELRALSDTFYRLALDTVPSSVTKGQPSRVFEGARPIFGLLMERAKEAFTLPGATNLFETLCETVNLTCDITGEPLSSPVRFRNMTVERETALIRQPSKDCWLFDSDFDSTPITNVPSSLITLIRRTDRQAKQLLVVNSRVSPPSLLSPSLAQDFSLTIRLANSTDVKIHAPLSLKAGVVTPAVTLDEAGFNTVFLSRGGPCSSGEVFLRPCHGGELELDVNLIAARLAPIITMRQVDNDWQVDAFAGTNPSDIDLRPVEEAVVIALDLSRSMESSFQSDDEDEPDWDTIALEGIRKAFQTRSGTVDDSILRSAKAWISDLDCLRNMARRLPKNENEEEDQEFGQDVLDELIIILAREHLTQKGLAHPDRDRTRQWENFVATADSETMQGHLIEHLLIALKGAKDGSIGDSLVPQRFLDPLSGEIMTEPFVTSDGLFYEATHIRAWRMYNSTSPLDPDITLQDSGSLDTVLQTDIRAWRDEHRYANFPMPAGRPISVEITRRHGSSLKYVTYLNRRHSVLGLLFDLWYFNDTSPSTIRLWSGLSSSGDGRRHGTPLDALDHFPPGMKLAPMLPNSNPPLHYHLELEALGYFYKPSGAEATRRASRTLTRLAVVQQCFNAFVNKIQSFDLPIALGLVTFGKEVAVSQELTMNKESFRSQLMEVTAAGDTPLFDSLSTCHTMLSEYATRHRQALLRIVVLTDGVDYNSTTPAHAVARRLQRDQIKLDAINLLGPAQNLLHAVAVVTGGYSFRADNLENSLAIMELETVLASKDRIERPAKPMVWNAAALTQYRHAPLDEVTIYSYPGRKSHARLNDAVQRAHKILSTPRPPSSTQRGKRLMEELRNIVTSPHPAIDVYASDADLGFWKFVIEAPEGSAYEGGTFLAYIDFPESYPSAAPEVRFMTKILHPNINRHGKVCHSALDRSYVASLTIRVILDIVYGLLLTPDAESPFDLHATMEYVDDSGQHRLKLHEMVQKFALKTRDQWGAELDP